MNLIFFVVRGVLAVVFATAALAKLADQGSTRHSLVEFGLPARLAAPAAAVLPVAELIVAGLLIRTASAVDAGVAAIGLLLIFTGAIARALARGERPACACFGDVSARPVGQSEVVRNVVLVLAAAVVVAFGPGDSVGRALAGVDPWAAAGLVVLVAVLVIFGFLGYQLFRQNARLLARIEALEQSGDRSPAAVIGGLAVGEPAPGFSLPDLSGQPRTLAQLLEPGRPVALAFSDPNCGACGPMLPRLAQLRAAHDGELVVALITSGGAGAARERVNGYAFDAVLLQQRREIIEAYRVAGVPSAVLITPAGTVAGPVAVGRDAIERLLGPSSSPPSAKQLIEVNIAS